MGKNLYGTDLQWLYVRRCDGRLLGCEGFLKVPTLLVSYLIINPI